jgi:hypothetical protein
MSALGQKQTSPITVAMSALRPKADIAEHGRHVRFVPKADILRCGRDWRLRCNAFSSYRHECPCDWIVDFKRAAADVEICTQQF